jgi:hypothetical protein
MPADETIPPAYTVVEETPGCATCGHGRTWAVIGPGGVAESISYVDEEDAASAADALNEAFAFGRDSAKKP